MSSKRRGLGRGLDSLLGPEVEIDTAAPEGSVIDGSSLPINALEPNPHQPRTAFDDAELASLTDSIRRRGLMQPIVVSAVDGGYRIVAGERRWRAAKRAGLERVPVVRRDDADEQEMLELALVENLQRTDLNPVDEAAAYAVLRDRHQLSQLQIATAVGKNRATVANALRLLELPESVRKLLREGALTAGQARPMLSLGDPEAIAALAERAVAEGLSARQLEALVRNPGGDRKRSTPRPKEVHTAAAEEQLARALQTKVEIAQRGNRGVIKVHFHSEDELMRLFDVLNGDPQRG